MNIKGKKAGSINSSDNPDKELQAFGAYPVNANQVYFRIPFRFLKSHVERKIDAWSAVEQAGISAVGLKIEAEAASDLCARDFGETIMPETRQGEGAVIRVDATRSDIWIKVSAEQRISTGGASGILAYLDNSFKSMDRPIYKYLQKEDGLYAYPNENNEWAPVLRGYLGIDAGSISINSAFVDQTGIVLEPAYTLTEGDVLNNIKKSIARVAASIPRNAEIAGTGVTGSGHEIARAVVNADVYETELDAHAEAAIHMYPDAKVVFDIGGQDSKVLYISDGMLDDAGMNKKCGAGTGAFLNAQAARLGIPIEDFGRISLTAPKPYRFSSICTVFVGRDLIAEQAKGNTKENIIAGLHRSLAMNFFSTLGIDKKKLTSPVIFQGGVAANIGVTKALQDCIQEAKGSACEIIVPTHHDVMGAIGMALHARKIGIESTGFRGFENIAKIVSVFSECGKHKAVNCKSERICDIVKLFIGSRPVETLYACKEFYEISNDEEREEKSA